MTSTHIRIPEEVKQKLDSLSHEGETVGAVIARLIEFYENKGEVNEDVNKPVNSSPAPVNDELTSTLTDILARLSALEQDRAPGREVVSSVITGDSPIPGAGIPGDASDKSKETRPRKKASSEISDRDMALIELMATIPRTKLKEMGCRGYGDLAKYRNGEKSFKDVTYRHNVNALKQNGYMIETPSPGGT